MSRFTYSFLPLSILASWLVMLQLTSCDKVSFDRVTGKLSFGGVDGFASTSEGYVVSWKPAVYDEDVSYSVYLLESGEGPGLASGLSGTPQDLQAKGTRVAKLYQLGEGVGPAFETAGSLITSQLDKNYYLIPPAYISQTKNYLIQTVAETSDGKKSSGGGRAIYLFTDAIMKGTFYGCLSSTATGSDSITITYQWPEAASRISIMRNGKEIYSPSSRSSAEMTYQDEDQLNEGQTYTYTCVATVNGENITGERTLSQKTLSSNPPNFLGIKTVAAYGVNGVTVSWNVTAAGSVRPANYLVYRSTGTTLDWTAAPVKTLSSSALSTTITGIGDELTYTFGVRACTSDPVCDTNTQTLQYTVPNSGAPTTVGATEVGIVNGSVTITAPWDHTKGALAKRYVYQKTGAASASISDYTMVRTVTVSDRYNPSTALTVSNLSENTTYAFIVRDEDPSGFVNTSTASVSMNTGDLTPPNFGGITALALGSGAAAESTLIASFTGVVQESSNPATGASAYLVYLATGNVDSCGGAATLYQTIPNTTSAGASLSTSITGLSPRTTYSVCIKARDTAGNISATTSYLPKTTLDTTAPYFDGIQTLTYNPAAGRMDVAWNASTSSDVYSYSVRIWKNSASSSGATTLTKIAASFPAGFNFTTSDFSYTAGDTLYVKVDACDDAQLLSGGTQNCTNKADSTAKVLQVPDVVPPASFAGVSGSGSFLAPAEGQVTVAWTAPPSWTDYTGFKIYTVNTTDNSISLVKDCSCSGTNCPDHITSCTVTGLNAYKTYYFHVRAYDDVGNLTSYLSAASSRTPYRTTDTSAPSFSSNLQTGTSGGAVTLTYTAASDNQSSEGSLSYKIYRKASSTFGSATNPSADGTLVATKTVLTHSDTSGVTGTTYYYTVCAVDSSNNTSCDGNVKSAVYPDSTAPTISTFTSNKTTDSQKEWTLSWTMSDNITSGSLLRVRIYRSYTSGSAGTATSSDTELTNANGDTASMGSTSLPQVRGVAGTNTYINYLLRVEDEAGNVASSTLSLYSQNAVTISAIWPASGVTAGGKYVVIDGTGIDDNATVTIGTSSCTGKIVIRSGQKIACKTPAGGGLNDVTITNPSGAGSATLASAYTYSDSVYCNSSGRSSATPFANSSDGSGADGTNLKPYKICTFAQLDAIRTSASSGSGKYWELAEHIDAAGQTFTPLTFNGSSNGSFNGNNYMIANATFTTASALSNQGVFARLAVGYIKNLGVVNANFSYTGGSSVVNWGLVTGIVDSGGYIDNVYTSGSLDLGSACSLNCGFGGIVGQFNNASSYLSNAVNNASITAGHRSGGVVGRAVLMASMTNITNTGAVLCKASGANGYMCGGILGTMESAMPMTNITNSGSVTGEYVSGASLTNLGGIIGQILPLAPTITLTNLVATGTISGTSMAYVGGLIGNNVNTADVRIINSHYSGTIDIASCGRCGGIVGMASSGLYIQNTYSKGTLSQGSSGTGQGLGGIIGALFALSNYSPATTTIASSYSTMSFNSPAGANVGGLVGVWQCQGGQACTSISKTYSIQDSYYNGEITCAGNCGGLVGYMSTGPHSETATYNITRSYAKGTITNSSTSTGGLVGIEAGGIDNTHVVTFNITDSYSTMTLNSSSTLTGGLIGAISRAATATQTNTITRSFYSGLMNATSARGLVGSLGSSGAVTCVDDFYDTTISGATISGCTTGGTSKTTTEMQSSSTFTNFDFTAGTGVWKMPATTGFPMLMWQ